MASKRRWHCPPRSWEPVHMRARCNNTLFRPGFDYDTASSRTALAACTTRSAVFARRGSFCGRHAQRPLALSRPPPRGHSSHTSSSHLACQLYYLYYSVAIASQRAAQTRSVRDEYRLLHSTEPEEVAKLRRRAGIHYADSASRSLWMKIYGERMQGGGRIAIK